MYVNIGGKVRDMGYLRILDKDDLIFETEGYMPDVPLLCGGDYIDLYIDNETGRILGWTPLNIEKLKCAV